MDNWGDKLIKFSISQAPIFLTLQSKKKTIKLIVIAHHYTSLVIYVRKQ